MSFFPLSLLTVIAAAPDQEVELVWAPAEGARHEHEWMTGHRLFLETFTRKVDDELEARLLKWSVTSERHLTAVDELRKVSPERPLEVRREFVKAELIGRLMPVGAEEETARDVKMSSPMAGTSVVWTWIDDEQEFGRYFDALEGEENLLPLLREDLSLRALLPAGPVQVGETWALEPARLRDVLDPGGDLSLAAPKGSDPAFLRSLGAGIGGGLHRVVEGKLAGSASAKLDSVENGVAQVTVRLDRMRYLTDLDDYVAENRLGPERAIGAENSNGRVILDLTGSGKLVWDLTSGRAVSFELEADEVVELTITSKVGERTMVETMKMIGDFNLKYTGR